MISMFFYYWLPGYLFTALRNFNWMCVCYLNSPSSAQANIPSANLLCEKKDLDRAAEPDFGYPDRL